MNKVRLLLVPAVLLMIGLASLALGGTPPWEGRPAFKAGETRGYFVWHDNDGWHLRWTTRGKERSFSGTISCDGTFNHFKAIAKDKGDYIKKVNSSTIRFDTRTAGGVDGIDFRLSPQTNRLTFELNMDGKKMDPSEIRVGSMSKRADGARFTLDRGPYREKGKAADKEWW